MEQVKPKAYIRKDTAKLIGAKLPGDFPRTVRRFYDALNSERQGLTDFYTGQFAETYYLLRVRPEATDRFRQQATLFCNETVFDSGEYGDFIERLAEFLFAEYPSMMHLEMRVPEGTGREDARLVGDLYADRGGKRYLDGESLIFERGFFGRRRFAIVPFRKALTWLIFVDEKLTGIYFTPLKKTINAKENPFAYFALNHFKALREDGTANPERIDDIVASQHDHFSAYAGITEAIHQIEAYFRGDIRELTCAYVFPEGTPFQQKVWRELLKIPYGSTRTYEQIAEAVADVAADGANYSRAVGAACGANPLAVIIPCHRVIGKNRDLVGFSGGVETKAKLLDLEILNYSA